MSNIPQSATANPDPTQIVNPATLQFRRAIRDIEQAYSIAKRLIQDSAQRNAKAAAIARKYNDEQPWPPEKMKAAGQGWRHNRSTGFLSSMVKRIMPPYKQAIDSARVLTSSMLREQGNKADQKNEDFRVETTKTIRRWDGWHNFTHQLILENILYGYTAGCYTDEFEWKPIFCRQDEAFFPDGCPQDGQDVPLWLKTQDFMIHELAKKLEDPEISKAVGWNIDNLVISINEAQPVNRMKGTVEDERKYQDTIRESNLGQSYTEGVKAVKGYHLFVQEYNGKVSHILMDGRTGKELMTRLDRFENMEECLSLFAIEVGNGKLHGSKGAGRVLYNTHVAIEQSRNLIADHLYLSSLVVLKATGKGKNAIAIKVQHPVAILAEDYEIQQAKWEVNTEAFFALDRHMSQIAELQVGAFMPGQLLDSGGEKRTASEINYVASIEKQIREGLIARFWGQFMNLEYGMQKRLCSQDNILSAMKIYRDEKSKIRIVSRKMWDFLVAIQKIIRGQPNVAFKIERDQGVNKEGITLCLCLLRKGLSPEEIYELAQCPPNEVTQDMASQLAEGIAQVSAKYMGNPRVRQTALIRKDIAATVGNTIADELVIEEEDQTEVVEAVSKQLMEITTIMAGEEMPASPRDFHEVHMDTIQEKVKNVMATLTPDAVNEDSMAVADAILKHYDEHLNFALGAATDPASLAPREMWSKGTHGALDKARQLMGLAPQNQPIPEGVQPAILPEPGAPTAPPALSGIDAVQPAAPSQPVVPNSPGGMPLSQGPMNL